MSRNRPEALRLIQDRSAATSSRVHGQVASLLAADPSPAGQIRAALHAEGALDTEGDRVRARGHVGRRGGRGAPRAEDACEHDRGPPRARSR